MNSRSREDTRITHTVRIRKELGVVRLLAKSDSLLITRSISGSYQAKDPQLASHLRYVNILKKAFSTFELVHVPREQIPKSTSYRSWPVREREEPIEW